MKSKVRIFRIYPVAKGEETWGKNHAILLGEIEHTDLEVTQVVSPDIEITSVTSNYDSDLVAAAHAKEAMRAEKEGYDAIIVGCLLEPGIAACKEAVSIPVVGDCGASLHLASLLAPRFSFILSGSQKGVGSRMIRDMVRHYGFEDHVASYRVVGYSTLQFSGDNIGNVVDAMLMEARIAIEQDGAEAIVGYGGPAVFSRLRAELPVPVVSPFQASILAAEMLARSNLSHSKFSYPIPDRLKK